MRKFFGLFALLIMTTATLTACGGDDAADTGTETEVTEESTSE